MPLSKAAPSPRMLVATHKRVELPHDGFHFPIQVGSASSGETLSWQQDDVGINISSRNQTYCELTALYWAWQNLDFDGLGLSHYRRYFEGTGVGPRGSRILEGDEAAEILRKHDLLVARRRHYVVESVESHYRNAHVAADLEALQQAVAETSPEFTRAFGRVMDGRSLSLYNMFLGRGPVVDEYAGWLFDVLERTEEAIDLTGRSPFQRRALGYLGERLLNVWIEANPALGVARRKVVNTEPENLAVKTSALLRRKFKDVPR